MTSGDEKERLKRLITQAKINVAAYNEYYEKLQEIVSECKLELDRHKEEIKESKG